MTEYTLSILKPDAVKRNITGKVNSYFENNGLKIVAQKMVQLTASQAEKFYEVHKVRPFYGELVNYMISGSVVIQVLKGENAVLKNRDIMGATNPKDASKGTIRGDLGVSIEENTAHGSDSLDNAKIEIAFFFAGCELVE